MARARNTESHSQLASMKVPTRRWGNFSSQGLIAGHFVASLNESPHPKVGKWSRRSVTQARRISLNESPHPKVGKCFLLRLDVPGHMCLNESPHPKVGKSQTNPPAGNQSPRLNESPHPKVGKYDDAHAGNGVELGGASMKVPTRRWGNQTAWRRCPPKVEASMKVPTRRWGNEAEASRGATECLSLNESPHPKVGKYEGDYR